MNLGFFFVSMRLILVRHGETFENKLGIIQGQTHGTLTAEGINQAKLLAKRLKFLKIDFAYSSDLDRCVKTAKEILKFHPKTKLILDKRIRERNLGDFQGKKIGKSDWDSLGGDILTNKPNGGESFPEMAVRVERFYQHLLKRYLNETILVVTSGGTLWILHGLIRKKTLKESLTFNLPHNTGISEYDIDSKGEYKEICFNCVKHL